MAPRINNFVRIYFLISSANKKSSQIVIVKKDLGYMSDANKE